MNWPSSLIESADSDLADSLDSFAGSVEGRLPRKLRNALEDPMTLEFGAESDFQPVDWKSCDSPSLRSENLARLASPSDWLGERILFRKIVINPALRQAIVDGPEKIQGSCRHGTTYDLALASVIHQLARAYDLRVDQDREFMQKLSAACSHSASGDSPESGQNRDCLRLRKMKHRVSDRPSFLALTHFFESPTGYQSGYRDPDPKKIRESEPRLLLNPAEAFAASVEHFLLDPAFSCEHPGIWEYLARHFKTRPPGISCGSSFKAKLLGGLPREITLDASRVYRIEYLYALPGAESMIESFGHAMLRVVSCSPQHATPEASCLEDESSHYVLTAYGQDGGKNIISGLTGDYSAQLYVYDYPSILKGYVSLENRPIDRVPLKLTREDIAVLIGTAYEWNKNYQGRWFDLTNNCVTHTFDLIQAAAPQLDFLDLRAITPGQLMKTLLKEHSLSDGTVERIGPK